MIPRRHSTKLPTISSIRPIIIRAIQGRPYAQSGVFSRSRGTATKRRTQGRRSGCSDNDDSRLLQQGPSNTLLFLDIAPRTATADVARPMWADRSSMACSYALGYLEPQIREILMDMKGGWRYELRYHRTLIA